DRHRVSSGGQILSIGKAKCTLDDSCRGTAHSAVFQNQSCSCFPFLFYNRPVHLKHTYAHTHFVLTRILIQMMNINYLSIHTHITHTHRL
ncbi:unnamed protein product, partial [Hymenolepis diminuta]